MQNPFDANGIPDDSEVNSISLIVKKAERWHQVITRDADVLKGSWESAMFFKLFDKTNGGRWIVTRDERKNPGQVIERLWREL